MRITIEFEPGRARKALRLLCACALVCGLASPLLVSGGQVGSLLQFQAGGRVNAADFNSNFDALRTAVNDTDTKVGSLSSLQTSAKSNLVVAVNEAFTKASTGVAGPQGPAGTNGTNGAAGADGSVRVFGDGSAGTKTVGTNSSLSDTNLQYTDFTVNNGVTLTIAESGLVIRCSGTFTVQANATITVGTGCIGGEIFGTPGGAACLMINPPGLGVASRAAGNGEIGDNTNQRAGASGGSPFLGLAKTIRFPGAQAGGGGGNGKLSAGKGGPGGGSLVILAKQGISIGSGALIQANGGTANVGGGGGGGGIVILATPGTFSQNGTIRVKGGAGGNNDSGTGPGAGGGGGIVTVIAPGAAIGTTDVAGGAPGTNTVMVSDSIRSGGGGGGACGGAGGGGGGPPSGTGSAGNGQTGDAGTTQVISADPTSLFLGG